MSNIDDSFLGRRIKLQEEETRKAAEDRKAEREKERAKKSNQDALRKFQILIEGLESKEKQFSEDAWDHQYSDEILYHRFVNSPLPQVLTFLITEYQKKVDDEDYSLHVAKEALKFVNDANYFNLVEDSEVRKLKNELTLTKGDYEALKLEHEQLKAKYESSESERTEYKLTYSELKENYEAITRICPNCNQPMLSKQDGEDSVVRRDSKT